VTIRNLEITHNLKDGASEGSLLWLLDETLTPMGGRFLRSALTRPLISSAEIVKRQDQVSAIIEDYELLEALRTILRKIQDIDRIVARIIARSASPRDVIALRDSIERLPEIRKHLASSQNQYIKEIGRELPDFAELVDLIDFSIVDNPPLSPKDGGILKKGFNKEVDELRTISV